jgi:uncharacterized protein YdaT
MEIPEYKKFISNKEVNIVNAILMECYYEYAILQILLQLKERDEKLEGIKASILKDILEECCMITTSKAKYFYHDFSSSQEYKSQLNEKMVLALRSLYDPNVSLVINKLPENRLEVSFKETKYEIMEKKE